MEPHAELIYDNPVESEEDQLARVMAAADIGTLRCWLSSVSEHGTSRRYRVCVEVAGRHIEPFL